MTTYYTPKQQRDIGDAGLTAQPTNDTQSADSHASVEFIAGQQAQQQAKINAKRTPGIGAAP